MLKKILMTAAMVLALPMAGQAAELEIEFGMGPTIAGQADAEKVARTQFRIGHVVGSQRMSVFGVGFTNAGSDAELYAADVYWKMFLVGGSGSDASVFGRLIPGVFFFSSDGSVDPRFSFTPGLVLGVQTSQDGRFGLIAEAQNNANFESGELFTDLTIYGKLIAYFGHDRGESLRQ